ncbi:hypothetical protein [Nocardia abscessus]|nr:hypothetical protein [Nocardia abscessus]MCC3333537.1 hypothetical protein [Nocardia abscessus]
MSVKFKNGRVATEEELDAIARAFGFMSWQEMERTCRYRDARRARDGRKS